MKLKNNTANLIYEQLDKHHTKAHKGHIVICPKLTIFLIDETMDFKIALNVISNQIDEGILNHGKT